MPRPSLTGLIAGGLVALTSAVPAQEAERERLEGLESAIGSEQARADALEDEATMLAADIADLRRRLIAAAAATQNSEQVAIELADSLADLDAERTELLAALSARRGDIVLSLMALQRLSLHPPDSLVAVRASPTDTIRSALLLRDAVPRLQSEAQELSRRIGRLEEIQAAMARNRDAYTAREKALTRERAELEVLVEEMSTLQAIADERARESAVRVAALAEEAADLRDLIDRLEAAAALPAVGLPGLKPRVLDAPAVRSFESAQGRLTPPAVGPVVAGYGEAIDGGGSSRGMSIAARPSAQVVAPFDGRIAFAGPFRGYGDILIIEHSDGYHTLLAGLDRIYVIVDQWVLSGEPVGVMSGAENSEPRLYVELRRNGTPINPSPWLTTENSKESG